MLKVPVLGCRWTDTPAKQCACCPITPGYYSMLKGLLECHYTRAHNDLLVMGTPCSSHHTARPCSPVWQPPWPWATATQGARCGCMHAEEEHLTEVESWALHTLVPQPHHWLAQTGATPQLMHTCSRHQVLHVSPPSISLPLASAHCVRW